MNQTVNFYVIGAQKAGTSWLYHRLKELPEFSLPPVKQLHYFDRSPSYNSPNKLSKTRLLSRIMNPKWLIRAIGVTGLTILKGKFSMAIWYLKWFFSTYSDRWFISLFNRFDGISGEITPSYSILEEKDIQRMAMLTPDAKIVFILRNPIERAWSHYRYNTRNIANFDINNVELSSIIAFINSPEQELRSNYLETIKRYKKYFSEDQILIGFYDAISEKPVDFLKELVVFLGGKSSQEIKNYCKVDQRSNVSRKVNLPPKIQEALNAKYKDTIVSLSNTLAGYAQKWENQLSQDIEHNEHIENTEIDLPATICLNKITRKVR